ncbi:TIGR01244 family phosphatase [Gluconacetobacter entanii]|uniref:TIGR01244 family protein n=1 Tax=Gluconacetobacter entanii TaxID=108528 RepID=A0A318PV90_9PROT|nr:TIGR01244 family sulfur transferase [Gluconacetobacter entanii]MBE7618944.1 TIGR01244 family phosphatase [Komagataeibacter sp. FXV2]MCE2577327.1 TIGR01244 family phosphatase [Komagataeibacter sp. FNDCR1]MBY4639952.1 TIGR01244 family phosphatase [Gluconacetobacter entanii]MCW4581795.1 TIGR01244 family sulfur transferase [Gluconacetobacter entanii]MCW4585087.1 TIGR01244 family sulfur transferase [Gluconacetobacter entanii]
MQLYSLSPDFTAASQITPDDLPTIVSQGFRSIICMRPDGEEYGQPTAESLKDAAVAAGLQFAFLPVVPGHITEHEVTQMRQALKEMDGPILGYCRSGNRVGQLWTLAHQG